MALLNFEHFDLYGTSSVALGLVLGYSVNNVNPVTGGRTGTHCLRLANSSGTRGITFTLPSARTVVGQGCAFSLDTLAGAGTPASQAGLRFNGTTVRVAPYSGGGIRVLIGGTEVGAAPAMVSANTWFWLEAKVTAGTGTASVEVRLNGAEILRVTDLTIPAITTVALQGEGTTSSSTVFFDDWVVWDDAGSDITDFMGDTFIIVGPPEADTVVADWDASTGTARFAMIDEAAPSDADYIQSDNIGDACEFTHPAFNLGIGAIAAIASQTRALKSDAGAASYATGLASGSSTSMSPGIALATGANVHRHISPRNPNGGAPWTQAAANAARLRVERTG